MKQPDAGLIIIAASFWVAFLAAALLASPILKLLVKLKSRQTVSQYAPEGHQLKQGTPTMGGLIIVAGAVISMLLWAPLARLLFGSLTLPGVFRPEKYQYYYFSPTPVQPFWALPSLVIAFGLIGFVDDYLVPRLIKGKRGLGWKQKILMQVFAALLALPALSLSFTAANVGLVVLVVLFFSNAYNFADGLDGLAGVLALLLFGGFFVLAMIFDRSTPLLCAALVGAVLPFLWLNAPPAKVFMGDVGSLPIGALLGVGVLGLFRAPGGEFEFSYALLIPAVLLSLVMVAELVPVPMQIFWVKVFKKRLFPYTPIHHAFEKAGWKETRVVFIFGIVQALCVAAAITAAIFLRPGAP